MTSWAEAAREPSLDELLAEPIVQMIMQRDGVRAGDVRKKLDDANTGKRNKYRL